MKKLLAICLFLSGCDVNDECRKYSNYTCAQIEAASYNVLFYFPNGEKEYFLGNVEGLKQCGVVAFNYANTKKLTNNDRWSYICCMNTKTSSCQEKHR